MSDEAILIYDSEPPAIVIETVVGSTSVAPNAQVYEGEELPPDDGTWITPFWWRRTTDDALFLVVDDGDGGTELIGFSDTFSDTFLD